MCVVLLDGGGGGGGGGGGLGDSLKACCNTVMQFAEFMHAGNNIVEGQAFLSPLRILEGPGPPSQNIGGGGGGQCPPPLFLLHCTHQCTW